MQLYLCIPTVLSIVLVQLKPCQPSSLVFPNQPKETGSVGLLGSLDDIPSVRQLDQPVLKNSIAKTRINTWRRVLQRHLQGKAIYPDLSSRETENILFLTLPVIKGPRKVARFVWTQSRRFANGSMAWDRFVEHFLKLFMTSEEMKTLLTTLYDPDTAPDVKVELPDANAYRDDSFHFAPSCSLSIGMNEKSMHLTDCGSKHLASIITQFFVMLIDRIRPCDLLEYLAGKSKTDPTTSISRFSNNLSFWLAHAVTTANSCANRRKMIRKIRKLGHIFYKRNHLQPAFIISSLLQINKLGDLIDEKLTRVDQYMALFDITTSFRGAREIHSSGKYIVPFFPVQSRDASHIHELSNFLEDGSINLEKLRSMAQLIVVTFQGNEDMHFRLYDQVPNRLKKHQHQVPISLGCIQELDLILELQTDSEWPFWISSQVDSLL